MSEWAKVLVVALFVALVIASHGAILVGIGHFLVALGHGLGHG
jgi:hypothetical protein